MCSGFILKNKVVGFVLFCLLVGQSFLFALDKDAVVAKGKIHKKIICDDDKGQSYALYLPSNYDAKKKWPVVFGFSPGAKGEHPVILSKDGAEKYGYIAVGSNNSKNGPSVPINKAFAAMKKDVLKKYNIDENRFYAIGFSGGSRVSLRFAFLHADQFKGVIACGAFFNRRTNFENKDVLLYGLVGDSGFNFPEYFRNKPLLDKTKIPYWVSVFKGQHQWPSKQLVFNGIEFFEFYHQKQNKTLDQKFEKVVFDRALELLKKSLKQKNWMNIYFGLTLLDRWFSADKFKASITSFKKSLKDTGEYDKKIKLEVEFMKKIKKLIALTDTPAYWKNLDDLLLMYKQKHPKSGLLKGSIGGIYQHSLRMIQQTQANPKAKGGWKQQRFYLALAVRINSNDIKLLGSAMLIYAKHSDGKNVKKMMLALKKNKYKEFADLQTREELSKFKDKPWFTEMFKKVDSK